MAKRSSGSGIAILIIIGILASISKEAWLVILILAGIVLVVYHFVRSQSSEQTPASEPTPATLAPHEPQTPSTPESKPSLSDAEILSIRQRAETLLQTFNETLRAANLSKDRLTREYKLRLARERLRELEQLAGRFPFLHLQNRQAVAASIAAVEAETRSLSYAPGVRFRQNTDPAVTSNMCWVGPEKEVEIKGLGSIGGMLYYGEGLASVAGTEVEPALINPKLPVVWPRSGVSNGMSYWPSYANISEAARGQYLTWLAGGRKGPNVDIGYVFLYFYGLERRVFADRQYPEAVQESAAILAEVNRLLALYGSNWSFKSYANEFLDFIVTLGTKDRIYKLPPPPRRDYKRLSLRHKLALGQAAIDSAPLPANWAYSWLMNDERFWPKTAATRCADEFEKLFVELYKDGFGAGMKLPVNKTLLKPLYKAASASFGRSRIELTGPQIPDVTVLEKPFNELKRIAERATEALQPYSRYVGKYPDRKSSGEALALLPTELWPAEALHSLTSWLVQLGVEAAPQVTTYGELLQHLPLGQPLKREGAAALCSSLEQIGVGMEPDVRWGGPLPAADSKAVFFSLTEKDVGAKPSPLYSAARLTMQLGVTVASADGEVSQDEQQHLEESLERWLHLSASEIGRLRAHLKWLLVAPPALTALKRQIATLKDEQKHALAAFLISTAQSNGEVSPAAVKVLTKIYRQFGFDEKELYSQLHVAATEPVTVQTAAPAVTGFPVPPKPVQRKTGDFVLNAERIAALTADSQRVSAILASIFTEDVQPQDAPATSEAEEAPAASSIAGLDTALSDLVRVLVSRDAWTRAELSDLAADRGVMLDGAIDSINEAFLETKDLPLLEGEDPIEVNVEIIKEFQVA